MTSVENFEMQRGRKRAFSALPTMLARTIASRRANAIPDSLQRWRGFPVSSANANLCRRCLHRLSLQSSRDTKPCRTRVLAPSQEYTTRSWTQSRPYDRQFRSQRHFSTTPSQRHNELTPPKPGEEYASHSLVLPCPISLLADTGHHQTANHHPRQILHATHLYRCRRRQPPRHSTSARPGNGRRLRRVLRLQHLPRHRDKRGILR